MSSTENQRKFVPLLKEARTISHNILILETISKFGYDPRFLKPHSYKPVIWECDYCWHHFEKNAELAQQTSLCALCSNKINANTNIDIRTKKVKLNWEINGHPRTGSFHSEESKRMMSLHSMGRSPSEDTRAKLSIATTGENNPFFGKKHSKDSLLKMSIASKANVRKGPDSNFYGKKYNGKGEWYEKGSSRIWMRSSWEIKFARHLDKQNIPWEYEPAAFPIIYEYEGVRYEGTFRPDFLVSNQYIEIKGYWRDDAQIKFESFVEQYPHFEILLYTGKELKELGVSLR